MIGRPTDRTPDPGIAAETRLARLALAVYVLLVVYASLHPLSGWRDPGTPLFAFLTAPRPRWVTLFDVMSNVLGYLPLGVLCAFALPPQRRGFAAILIAAACGAALSTVLETAQTFLPARVASNLDVMANTAGALMGGIVGAIAAPWLPGKEALKRLRAETFRPGSEGDLGLVLLALWLFAQINPTTLLFGAGDLRDLVTEAAGPAHAPHLFVSVEALTAAGNFVALSLLVSLVAQPGAAVRRYLLSLLVAALAARALAFTVLMPAEPPLAWLTPGAQLGVACGVAAALLAVMLPRTARLAIAAVLLMAATVLVNLSPPNPYTAAMLKLWAQGHFLNFNGLTRLVSVMWPFVALAYLVLLAARGGSERALR
ncbi:MAG TPA: VanZ family protein [Burkholderiales bacterium]|jgi:VanZ family protein|nr:VanZ family protein [Burkholderiales bacterium]